MNDAIELTVGDMMNFGIHSLRILCEKCGQLEFETVKRLEKKYGSYFPSSRISCDSCGGDELFLSPRMLE